MPRYTFHMGVTLRCYGNVEVAADSIETALPLLTADFVGEHIDITETTTDSGQDLAIIDVTTGDGTEDAEDWGGYSLPSPYDPPDTRELIGAGRELAALLQSRPIRSETVDAACERMRAAIAKAEGKAHG